MVADVTTETNAVAADEVVFDADIDLDDATVETIESEGEEGSSPEETPDPLAELRDGLAKAITRDEFQRAVTRYESEIGRAQKLEPRLAEFAPVSQVSALASRLAEAEEVNSVLVNLLAQSELLDDGGRSQLANLASRLTTARTARDRQQLRDEIANEIRGSQPASQPGEQIDPRIAAFNAAVDRKTAELDGYAAAKGVALTSLPDGSLNFRPGETVDAAFARVKALVDEQAAEGSSAERLANKKRAAGNGAPQRNGAATDIETLRTRAMTTGIPITDAAARKRLAADLGIDL